jgi:hypothetical protein
VLVLALFGVFMVVLPVMWKKGAKTVPIEGDIDTGGKSFSIVILAVPDYEHSQDASGHISFSIPLLETNAEYRVKFLVDKQVIDDQQLQKKKNGDGFEFTPVQWSPPTEEPATNDVKTKKDVSDEEIRKLLHKK